MQLNYYEIIENYLKVGKENDNLFKKQSISNFIILENSWGYFFWVFTFITLGVIHMNCLGDFGFLCFFREKKQTNNV